MLFKWIYKLFCRRFVFLYNLPEAKKLQLYYDLSDVLRDSGYGYSFFGFFAPNDDFSLHEENQFVLKKEIYEDFVYALKSGVNVIIFNSYLLDKNDIFNYFELTKTFGYKIDVCFFGDIDLEILNHQTINKIYNIENPQNTQKIKKIIKNIL